MIASYDPSWGTTGTNAGLGPLARVEIDTASAPCRRDDPGCAAPHACVRLPWDPVRRTTCRNGTFARGSGHYLEVVRRRDLPRPRLRACRRGHRLRRGRGPRQLL